MTIKKPLTGIRMLDLTHMLSGPYGGMILADLGCETIKVEPPVTGEGTRRLLENDPDYSINGTGAYFYTLNRNKKSVCIDLKNTKGLEVFYDLVKQSDIVLNNFSAGVTKKLKIDYSELKKINPRIITCTVSGFGEDGPDYKRPAFDQISQALGGGMSITGTNKNDTGLSPCHGLVCPCCESSNGTPNLSAFFSKLKGGYKFFTHGA